MWTTEVNIAPIEDPPPKSTGSRETPINSTQDGRSPVDYVLDGAGNCRGLDLYVSVLWSARDGPESVGILSMGAPRNNSGYPSCLLLEMGLPVNCWSGVVNAVLII